MQQRNDSLIEWMTLISEWVTKEHAYALLNISSTPPSRARPPATTTSSPHPSSSSSFSVMLALSRAPQKKKRMGEKKNIHIEKSISIHATHFRFRSMVFLLLRFALRRSLLCSHSISHDDAVSRSRKRDILRILLIRVIERVWELFDFKLQLYDFHWLNFSRITNHSASSKSKVIIISRAESSTESRQREHSDKSRVVCVSPEGEIDVSFFAAGINFDKMSIN